MTDSKMKIEYGNKVWRNEEGNLHRLDGPAVEGADGTKIWYVDGKLHRLDGPAIDLVCDAALCQQQGDDLWICRRRVHEGTTCYYFFEPVQKYEVKK